LRTGYIRLGIGINGGPFDDDNEPTVSIKCEKFLE
jgi:hypothetical protein